MATKVTAPKKANVEINLNLNTASAGDVIIQNVLKFLQKNTGLMTLHSLLEQLLKSDANLGKHFDYSSQGLLKYLSDAINKGPTYFNACIIGEVVYLINVYGKKKLKIVLQEINKGPSSVTIISFSDIAIEVPPKAPSKTSISKPVSAKLMITLVEILEKEDKGLMVDVLYNKVLSDREEDLKGTELESSLVNFKKFVSNHTREFAINPHGLVNLLLKSECEETESINKAIFGVKMMIWLKGGVVNIKNLVGHFSTVPGIRQVTGGSVDSLRNFITKYSSIFCLNPNGDVTVCEQNDYKDKAGVTPKCSPPKIQKQECPPNNENKSKTAIAKSTLNYCNSVVVTVFLKFGFIKFGEKEEDNIYFDGKSFVHPAHSEPAVIIDDLRKFVHVGDRVDCLFSAASPGIHKAKFKASVLWKIPNQNDNNLCLCLSPIVELPFPVILGSAPVTFLDQSVGNCQIVQKKTKKSESELNSQNKPSVTAVSFHLGLVLPPKKFTYSVKCGCHINFIAKPMVKIDGTFCSRWIAISIWDKAANKQNKKLPSNGYVTKAQVRELHSEGGMMSFGSDPWAHRATFSWEDLSSTCNELLTFAVGDSFWCVISEAGELGLGATKWVISQLLPLIKGDEDNPPLKFRHLPLEMSACDSTRTSPLKDEIIDLSSSPSSEEDLLDFTSLEPPLILNQSLLDLTESTSSLSLSTTNLSNIDSNSQHFDLNRINAVSESGILVSKDAYGGIIEGDDGTVVSFGAHSFYFNGRAISHMAFSERTIVHYEAVPTTNDPHTLTALKVWIGKKPEN